MRLGENMTKQEFLEELKSALSGVVSSEVMMDSYRYYSNYIEEEIRNGKTEKQVLDELGKPTLIARSIIAANTRDRSADEEYTEDGRTRKVKRKEHKAEKEKREQKEFHFEFNAWYAKIIYAVVLFLLIMLVFCIIKGLLWIFITFGMPILIILGIIYLLMYFTKSK